FRHADRLLRRAAGWNRGDESGLWPAMRAEATVPDLGKSQEARTDEQLLVAYREGERAAFETLIGRYRHELLNFLTRFLGNRAAAEDVFQETFLQIHLSAESFDATRTFKPWLFTIAANKARDLHRRQKRRQAASLSAPVGNHDEGASFVDLLAGDDETPDQPVARAEEAARIKAVVEDLPSHYREILLLSYFHRMSYQQIAETLSVPLGTVKSRLHSAVATFADQWRIAQTRTGPSDATA
ncbi:MAG: RNA polymerase sigma factor, partial [Phycisphaerales bacterium]